MYRVSFITDKLPLNHNLIVRLDKVLIAKKTEIRVIITHSVMWLELGLRIDGHGNRR